MDIFFVLLITVGPPLLLILYWLRWDYVERKARERLLSVPSIDWVEFYKRQDRLFIKNLSNIPIYVSFTQDHRE